MITLFDYQEKAISELKSGSILKGGVGSGKTLTSLGYYYKKEYPKDLYVITTPRKRDSSDWEKEYKSLIPDLENPFVKLVVDSWNNISKYKDVKGGFFIFDEQRVIGYGAWVKAFLKIAKNNNWILLSATPGDVWMDYLPVFIANGFYAHKSDFIRQHVVYNTYTNFPKIDRYVGEDKLFKLKRKIVVEMAYENKVKKKIEVMTFPYDREKFELIYEKRWNPYKDEPIKTASEAAYCMRRVVNSDPSRLARIQTLAEKHRRVIVFYNFDYELDILRQLNDLVRYPVAEYNGHIHESIPQSEQWIYLAQYISAGEAWNCIETNAIVLYSRNYSYRITQQAMGRIDRQNTPFATLFYYFFSSKSEIDDGITKSYLSKKNFNETKYFKDRFATKT